MTRRALLRRTAAAELEEAFRWYESQRTGLGLELLDCIEDLLLDIRHAPERFPVVYRNARQALVRRFPFVIYFLVDSAQIDVLAVIHGHRDPREWQSRV
jgi:plasmid stabilization system protein ParE